MNFKTTVKKEYFDLIKQYYDKGATNKLNVDKIVNIFKYAWKHIKYGNKNFLIKCAFIKHIIQKFKKRSFKVSYIHSTTYVYTFNVFFHADKMESFLIF